MTIRFFLVCRRLLKFSFCVFGLFFLFSCYKTHIFVQQEWVDDSFLASSYMHTPDPRKKNPPFGQKILIKWDYPLSMFKEKLSLVLTVRFWNNTEKKIILFLNKKRGYTSCFFPNKEKSKNNEILTYRIETFNGENELVEGWYHQLWTELIDFPQK